MRTRTTFWFAHAALAILGMSGLACGIPQEAYDRDMAAIKKKCADDAEAARQREEQQKARGDAAETQASSEKERADKTTSDLSGTRKALDECTNKGGNSVKSLASCQIERAEVQARLDRVSASVNKVRDALKAMSDAGKLQVKVARGFLIIALQGDILFDSGKSKLKEDAKPILLELAAILKSLPDRLFQVAGHTDSAGAEDLNWDLSMQRALTVVKFLIKDGGVEGKNLSAGGYAMFQPVADNATDQGKQTNRRVEFLLIPNLAELLNVRPSP